MKKRILKTSEPVRITPTEGDIAHIAITSLLNVAVDIINQPSGYCPPRRVRLCSTEHGTLRRSAQGQNRIVTLILPTEKATPMAFYHELDCLMDLATIQGKI